MHHDLKEDYDTNAWFAWKSLQGIDDSHIHQVQGHITILKIESKIKKAELPKINLINMLQ